MTDEIDRIEQLRRFVESMRAEPCGDDVFSATPPEGWGPRLFGGMVVALALSAALQTVDTTLRPHSLHGYFLRPVAPLLPSLLTVERLRDSRSFAGRQVTMEQEGNKAARFACSFHVAEDGDEYQLPMQDVPTPEDLTVGAMSLPFDVCDIGRTQPEPDGTYRSTARLWYRACGSLGDDPNVHVCMMALFSDMTRTSFRPLSLDAWGRHTDASIDHAVWFHRPARADQWIFCDFQALVNAGGRSLVRGSMYTRSGTLCMSMTQELLIRPLPGGDQSAPWTDASRS